MVRHILQIGTMPLLPEPRVTFRPWVTALCAALLATLMAYFFLFPRGSDDLDRLRFPGESAGRLVDRHLEFYEGYETAPAWEKAFFTFLFGSRQEVMAEAVQTYGEVLTYFRQHPDEATPWARINTWSRLLITLAETGQRAALQQELAASDDSLDAEVIREAVLFAYGNVTTDTNVAEIQYGARLLPLGWASDRLNIRIAEKLGQESNKRLTEHRLEARGERWRDRVLVLAGTVAAVVLGGLLVLFGRRRLERPTAWKGVASQSPWTATEGFAVLVRSGLMGLIIAALVALFAHSYFKPGVLALWSSLFASIPMVWLIHRNLLRPRGLTFASAFGLTLRGVHPGEFARITLAVLALEWCGTLAIAGLSWKFGLQSHWSEGIFEREVFGPWQTALLSGVNLVLWAPIFEEIGFRGLVYTTLRSRLTPWAAIAVSALVFSSLHLYSLVGFLSVFWSGVILAYAFERFGSLLPGMIVHAAGNLLAVNTVLLFYR
jgi:membrane protease YdiL (CAAX protease family)